MKSLIYSVQSSAWLLLAALYGLNALVNLACPQTVYGQAAPALAWQAVAASADGKVLLAVANTASEGSSLSRILDCAALNPLPASIYISTNAGATWNPTSAPTNLWQSVALSADGTLMVAAAGISFRNGDPPSVCGDGLIYISTNSGTTWMPGTAPNNAWTCVAGSADGTTFAAAASLLRPSVDGAILSGDGLIYISRNSGANWYTTSAPSDNWKSIACSSDATRFVASFSNFGF